MKVRKRNGKLQDFNTNKIKLTLERVSDEFGRPFTGADVNILIESIEKNITDMGEEIIDSAEIHKIVVKKLREFGFNGIANAYGEFEKRF